MSNEGTLCVADNIGSLPTRILNAILYFHRTTVATALIPSLDLSRQFCILVVQQRARFPI